MPLVIAFSGQELGISDQEMNFRTEQLLLLLPGLAHRLLRAPPRLLARAATHTSLIAERILLLKAAFPGVCCMGCIGFAGGLCESRLLRNHTAWPVAS